MWRLSPRLLAALAVTCGLETTAAAQGRPPGDADLERWLAAVQAHHPGSLDLHARAIAVWPWNTVQPVLKKAKALEDAGLLLRAAVLYLDVAVHVPRQERPAYPTDGRVLRMRDGNPIGVDQLDSHIWWARHLVDTAVRNKSITSRQLEIATRWYHVTSAILAGRLELADQHWHLKDARLLFPKDAVLLLDQGCLEETLGSPMIQQATARYLAVNQAPVQGQRRERFMPADENRRQAETLYQLSIAAATTGEARVRLGWVLAQRGRTADAIPHLEAATADPDEAIRYFGWLFLGHTQARQSQWDAAVKSYRAALNLFPEAQAAHLGLSRVAAERGATVDARKWLAASHGPFRLRDDLADPWWRYTWCRGRDYLQLHTGFAQGVAAESR